MLLELLFCLAALELNVPSCFASCAVRTIAKATSHKTILNRFVRQSSLCSQVAEPPACGSSPTRLHNKRDVNISQHLFYGVDKVTILEPNEKKIIANLCSKFNIHHKLILLMKLDTQTYYNIRMILGYEIQ